MADAAKLLKIAALIAQDAKEARAKHFNQEDWFNVNCPEDSTDDDETYKVAQKILGAGDNMDEALRLMRKHGKNGLPHCSTTLCIAGFAAYQWPHIGRGLAIPDRAARVLKLVGNEHYLFHATKWPRPFRDRFFRASTPTQKARVAISLLKRMAAGKVKDADWWEDNFVPRIREGSDL